MQDSERRQAFLQQWGLDDREIKLFDTLIVVRYALASCQSSGGFFGGVPAATWQQWDEAVTSRCSPKVLAAFLAWCGEVPKLASLALLTDPVRLAIEDICERKFTS